MRGAARALGPTFPIKVPNTFPRASFDEFLGDRVYQYEETKHVVEGVPRYVHARVDDLVFLDDRYRGKVPRAYVERNEILYLADFGWAMREWRLIRYSALCATALGMTGLEDETVLDFGAGDGALTALSLSRGAREAYAFDLDERKLDQLGRHLDANGIDRARAHTASVDVRDYYRTLERLPAAPTVVIANLGPHYDGADLAVINLLHGLPSVRAFIGGGYTRFGCYDPTTALRALRGAGFNDVRTVCERGQYPDRMDAHGHELPPRMAFLAERH